MPVVPATEHREPPSMPVVPATEHRELLLMPVVPATEADWPTIEALLADAGLPLDRAREAFSLGVVARDGDQVVGAAAVEAYGSIGLLRSVVVRVDRRGSGLGRRLVDAAEALARDTGLHELYLLTDSAETFFASLGYQTRPRSAAPAPIASSVEFRVACAETAVLMARPLAPVEGDESTSGLPRR